jgi:hypothetical protein
MKKLLYTLLAVSIIFSACEEEDAAPINNNNNSSLVIGDFNEGGVVFYLDGNGGGLVCDIQDLGMVPWGCEEIEISGSGGTAIGTGHQNTIAILDECSESTNTDWPLHPEIAAEECASSTAQGYSDWFLPSLDELREIYLNRSSINTTALANGGDIFGSSIPTTLTFWSSSEKHLNSAYQIFFNLNGLESGVPKSSPAFVRAVRAF